jgi:hypothetical protein
MTDDLTLISLNHRKIKNYLRKFSSTTGDENNLRRLLLKMFYYDIYGTPISIIKKEDEIKWDDFPKLFKLVKREDIIDIYNKDVKSSFYKELKILGEEELDTYKINPKNSLKISLKTFRPVYKADWKKLSEEVNNISFDKQKSYYAIYLKLYLKYRYFPSFEEFIKHLFYKYQMPIHRDIKIIFDNIENSYKDVKEFIKINDMNYKTVKDIIIKSTKISNRINIENN